MPSAAVSLASHLHSPSSPLIHTPDTHPGLLTIDKLNIRPPPRRGKALLQPILELEERRPPPILPRLAIIIVALRRDSDGGPEELGAARAGVVAPLDGGGGMDGLGLGGAVDRRLSLVAQAEAEVAEAEVEVGDGSELRSQVGREGQRWGDKHDGEEGGEGGQDKAGARAARTLGGSRRWRGHGFLHIACWARWDEMERSEERRMGDMYRVGNEVVRYFRRHSLGLSDIADLVAAMCVLPHSAFHVAHLAAC